MVKEVVYVGGEVGEEVRWIDQHMFLCRLRSWNYWCGSFIIYKKKMLIITWVLLMIRFMLIIIVLWLKTVPLKVNIFIWCLFLNHIQTKNNLVKRNILANVNTLYSADYAFMEDRDHLFFQCDLYGRLWSMICGWLSFSMVRHGNLHDHLL